MNELLAGDFASQGSAGSNDGVDGFVIAGANIG